jgi:hypothetical protein
MGTIQHHALIVTTWDTRRLKKAYAAAVRLIGNDLVTPIASYRINEGGSFAVLPDGSKEGWEESNTAEWQRSAFIEWLERQRYDDHSNAFNWVLVAFGEQGYGVADSGDERLNGLGGVV